MNIVVTSGKGGTGKTTFAVNFAYFLAESGLNTHYFDCDIEEPNGHIFLIPEINNKEKTSVMIPEVIEEKCIHCSECSSKCQFNAILSIKSDLLVFPELCHSCGLCIEICPENALKEGKREIGEIEEGKSFHNLKFSHGILNVGEVRANPVIEHVLSKIDKKNPLNIIDSPPGTSCPVVETISHGDAVIIVTEPTPFGLHDLKAVVEIAKGMNIPSGIIINKAGKEYEPLNDYIEYEELPVLGKIPEDRKIASTYSSGRLILKSIPSYRGKFIQIVKNLEKLLKVIIWEGK